MKSVLSCSTLFTLAMALATGSALAQSQLRPDVSVQFTGPSELQLDRADHYTLKVGNVGYAAAEGVRAVMTLPAGVSLARVPAGCTYTAPSSLLACTYPVIAVGETKTTTIDLRAPSAGPSAPPLTVSASANGDGNAANNSASHTTLFANFTPDIRFPATARAYICMGRANILDCALTAGTGAAFQFDANGQQFMSGVLRIAAMEPGAGLLNVELFSTAGVSVSNWTLTPFNSRCYQGPAVYPTLQATYEARICY